MRTLLGIGALLLIYAATMDGFVFLLTGISGHAAIRNCGWDEELNACAAALNARAKEKSA